MLEYGIMRSLSKVEIFCLQFANICEYLLLLATGHNRVNLCFVFQSYFV